MLDKGHAVKMKQSKRHDYIIQDPKLCVDYYRRPALQYYMFNVIIGCSIYISWRLTGLSRLSGHGRSQLKHQKIGVGGCTEEGLNHPLVRPCFVFSQTRPDQPRRNCIVLENEPTSSLALRCKPPQGSSFAAYAKFLTRLT